MRGNGCEPTVVIILQYIHISNQYVEHLKLTQCYMSNILSYNWGLKKKLTVSIVP